MSRAHRCRRWEDNLAEFSSDSLIPESDARMIVRLVADVARLNGPIHARKQHLMAALCGLVDADAWAWILSRAESTRDNPTVVEFLHGGMTEREFAAYVALMQNPLQTPVEYAALN
jgi:hypothetical protein